MCVLTGYARLVLECGKETGCLHEPGTDCRSRWSGYWPETRECAEYGLWFSFYTLKPCAAGAPGAMADRERLREQAQWDRETERWVMPANVPA